MSEVPDYARGVDDSIHSFPGQTPGAAPDPELMRPFFANLIEAVLRAVVKAIIGILLPGPAGAQLATWAGDLVGKVTGLFGSLFTALQGGVPSLPLGDLLTELTHALKNIPGLNILGFGGPANTNDTFQNVLDQYVGGAAGVPGGTGASFSDMWSISYVLSSWAQLGRQAFTITGIQGNKPLNSGFLRSSVSNIALDQITVTPGDVTITEGNALTVYKVIGQSMDVGAIAWQGHGTTGVTDFFVNLYKMDPATGQNGGALHDSADIKGILSNSEAHTIYSLVDSLGDPAPVHFEPGDIAAAEFDLRGAGTHTMRGGTSTLVDQAVFPRRWSSRRDPGGLAAPSSAWTPSYDDDVALVEFAVSAGDVPLPQPSDIQEFSTPGTTTIPIPDQFNFVDRIVLGGAGGGHIGGTWGVGGEGGDHATFASDTLERGVDFTSGDSLTTTVGDGGISSGNGQNGATSTSSISGSQVLSSTGGVGANSFDILGSEHVGESPGDYTFPGAGDEWIIIGGLAQNTYGAPGNPPGGGGAGGNWIAFQAGGKGAPGTIRYRFRQ